MKLIYSQTSPYARKVRIVAEEKGLGAQLALVEMSPLADNPALQAINPLHQVPVLVTDAGEILQDSRTICWWLDRLGASPRLMPEDATACALAMSREALGDGMCDALFALVMEGKRPVAERSLFWQSRWRSKFAAACAHLNGGERLSDPRLDIGDIAIFTALGYADFRLPHLGWRDANRALANWFERLAARPAMLKTKPPA